MLIRSSVPVCSMETGFLKAPPYVLWKAKQEATTHLFLFKTKTKLKANTPGMILLLK